MSTLAKANGTPYAPRLNLAAAGPHDLHDHGEPVEGKGRSDYSSVPTWATRFSASSPLGASMRSRYNCERMVFFPLEINTSSCISDCEQHARRLPLPFQHQLNPPAS